MPSGFNSRSLQGVKQVTPAYSKYYKLAKEAHAAGSHTTGNELFKKGAAIELSTGRTLTPRERKTAEAGERVLAAGQAAQRQQMQGGGWQNPAAPAGGGWQKPAAAAAIVAPIKGRFFGHLQGLPQEQQVAMMNRFGPQLQDQSILDAKENKAWLDVQEANRKVRRDQAADAATLQFKRRMLGIWNDPNKSTEQKETDMMNTVMANPLVLRNLETREALSEFSKGITRQLTEEGKERSHIRAAQLSAVSSLFSKSGDLGVQYLQRWEANQARPNAAGPRKARWDATAELGAFMEAAEATKGREELFEDTLKMAAAKPNVFDALLPDLKRLAVTDAQKLRLRTAQIIAEKIVGEEELDERLESLENYLRYNNSTLTSLGYKEEVEGTRGGGISLDTQRALKDLTETLVLLTIPFSDIRQRAGHIEIGPKKPYVKISGVEEQEDFINKVSTVNQLKGVVEALIESFRGAKAKGTARDEEAQKVQGDFSRKNK